MASCTWLTPRLQSWLEFCLKSFRELSIDHIVFRSPTLSRFPSPSPTPTLFFPLSPCSSTTIQRRCVCRHHPRRIRRSRNTLEGEWRLDDFRRFDAERLPSRPSDCLRKGDPWVPVSGRRECVGRPFLHARVWSPPPSRVWASPNSLSFSLRDPSFSHFSLSMYKKPWTDDKRCVSTSTRVLGVLPCQRHCQLLCQGFPDLLGMEPQVKFTLPSVSISF